MKRAKSDHGDRIGSAKSPHAFMREALGAKARLVESRQAFLARALAAEEEALESKRGYRAIDVDAYFAALAAGRSAPLPRLATVAHVIYARPAFDDLRRIYDSTEVEDPTLAANLSSLIGKGIRALEHHPGSGRGAELGLRERAISRGKTGYIVLYRFLELDDTVLVLAIRRRSEAGYPS